MKMSCVSILMVDDDEEDCMLLSDAFDELGYGSCIHYEENGEEAIRYLDQCLAENSLPSMIVLDLNMPKLNGKQTLRHIKGVEALQNIPVIIFSTSLNPREKEECLALGAHSYVIKPASYKDSIETANSFYALCNVIGVNGNKK
ncbi:response regulator [Flavisolibacter sp. BT320]|nr:response regulator [Flavisolibacter longurius]